ncbi:MAG: hypothetical protein LBH28_06405 [Oscillospiraceae bacterium]|jgi:hypothetical protein|nr:hypothetical protein [Oscillospiraceae bacterium]
MRTAAEIAVDYYKKLATEYQRDPSGKDRFVMHHDNFKVFEDNFKLRQEFVLVNYMDGTVKFLDRHKLSSIIVIELLCANVVALSEELRGRSDDNNLAIDEYVLATLTGLELLRYWLNKKLTKLRIPEITEWVVPKLLACPDNEYYKVFARNLLFTRKRNNHPQYPTSYNELELAEKMYLFEYITLVSKGIDIQKLQERHE